MRKPPSLVPPPVQALRPQHTGSAEQFSPLQIGRLIRKYLLLVTALVGLGVLAGFAVVIRETPIYKAQMLLEVNPINESYVRTSLDPLSGNMDPNIVNVTTQIRLLQSGPTVTNVWEDMVHEPPPPAVPQNRLARLRAEVSRNATSAISQLRAAGMAAGTFDARPIVGTRLIEMTTESIHPAIAAEFLNRVAGAFIKESDHSRVESSELTTQWLTKQVGEIKDKLDGADAELQRFVKRNGADFATVSAAQTNTATTLYDTELKSLQADLGTAQTARLSKQALYETAALGNIQDLPEVMDDPALKEIERKLADIKDEKRSLDRILTPQHYKIQRLEAEEQDLLDAKKARADAIVGRLKSEYDAALRKEKLLSAEYDEKGRTVVAQTAQVTEYAALKREVDSLQGNYDTLSQRLSQTGAAAALPVGLIRIVARCTPPSAPYRPQPATTVALGAMGGVSLAVVIVFLREKTDKSIRAPGVASGILDLAELGVIPEAGRLVRRGSLSASNILPGAKRLKLMPTDSKERVAWTAEHGALENGVAVMIEAFRFTLASLVREAERTHSKVIMVTSAEAGDGKTTIVANLGVALAESGKRVVIVDADLRKPRMHQIFDTANALTLADILQDTRPVEDYLIPEIAAPSGVPNLYIMPGSEFAGNIARLLYSTRIGHLIKRLRQEFDFVFVDVSPIGILADARVISPHVDGAALVIRSGHTDGSLAIAASQYLADDGVHLLGSILNQWTPDRAYRRRYEKYYSQAS